MSTLTATGTRTCRILYYGPRGAGKRENLRQIAGGVPSENRLQARGADELAFRLRTGQDGEWRVVLQAVDTGREPGGDSGGGPPFDGVVFVAHSAAPSLDTCLSAMEQLKAFLDAWGEDVTSVPLVIQYNAREQQGALPLDRLEGLLNPWGLLSFPASSRQGEGVKETLRSIISLTISRRLERGDAPARPASRPPEGRGTPEAPGRSVPAGRGDGTRAEPRPPARNPGRGGERGGPAGGGDLQIVHEEPALFFDDIRPPIVVPVRIPRRLLDKFGSARIVLEVEVIDQDPLLG